MSKTPRNSYVEGFGGVNGGGSQRNDFTTHDRWVERKAIRRIETEGETKRKNLELCEVHVLPVGVVCESRVEKKGFMFCSGSIEGCPLRKRV